MSREFVTKSARFYAVSLRPDICKTPVGNSMPPIPYTIKGEFSEAVGTAVGVTSHNEPMAIADSTRIPTVTGDAPGTGKGIKSGTVGKQVQHDEHSKTVKFNGQRAIREGDRVTMNDGNTQGKIFERGGEAAKPRIGSVESASPPKTFGDRFEESVGAAADRIEQGKQWVGEKVGQFSQTTVGSKVMGGLQWLSEKTELTEVKAWKEGLARNVDDAAVGSGNKAVMAAGAVTVAALEFVPTSLLDLIPGGGKSAGTANKLTRTASAAKQLAAEAGTVAHKGQQFVSQAGHASENVAQAAGRAEEKAAAAAAHGEPHPGAGGGGSGSGGSGGSKPPSGGGEGGGHGGEPGGAGDGGKSKKSRRTGEKGKCGEWLAKLDMARDGFDEIVEVQNNSGHGVDLIGRNSTTGEVKVWEVKTTDSATPPALSKEQAEKGGKIFTADRLKRAEDGRGNYGKVPKAMENAKKAKRWLTNAQRGNKPITYEKREVFVDDLDKGCMKHPGRPSKSKPW